MGPLPGAPGLTTGLPRARQARALGAGSMDRVLRGYEENKKASPWD